MNSKLDSFDNNKIKCKICNEYFDKSSFSLVGSCKKCWIEKIDRFRQTGGGRKSELSFNLRYRPELFQK